MNTPKDKPPTRESVEAAQRFAASLSALPEPQEKQPTTATSVNDLYLACKPLTVDYYKIDHRDMLLRIVERCHEMMATAAKPTNYERGFMDGYLAGGSSGYQAGLRKAASHV